MVQKPEMFSKNADSLGVSGVVFSGWGSCSTGSLSPGLASPLGSVASGVEVSSGVEVPSGVVPSGVVPSGAVPSGAVPSGVVPSGVVSWETVSVDFSAEMDSHFSLTQTCVPGQSALTRHFPVIVGGPQSAPCKKKTAKQDSKIPQRGNVHRDLYMIAPSMFPSKLRSRKELFSIHIMASSF